MANSRFKTIKIAGLIVDVVGRKQLASAMLSDCLDPNGPRGVLVFDANGQGVSLNATSASFRKSMEVADIVHADGEFIVRMSRLFSSDKHIPDRTVTTDVIHDFAEIAAQNGLSFYLLGGPEGLAKTASDILLSMYPGLRIAGSHHGYFAPEDEERILSEINESEADIVWVGLGKPKEQNFCARHKGKFNCTWVVTCGGCFNYLTGQYRRAPIWMQKYGLEWLYRMLTTKGLFMRYLVTTPHAFYLAITQSSSEW